MTSDQIESVQGKIEKIYPSKEFIEAAGLSSEAEFDSLYQESILDPDLFWNREAEKFFWFKKWKKVFDWNEPFLKAFVGGETNMSFNCLDRHLKEHSQKLAIIFESENGEIQKITYKELHKRVCQLAHLLTEKGVQKGDRVMIYMPLIPEALVNMLATTRIGAVHSVVFGGFSSQALKDRILDCKAKAVITADGGFRPMVDFGEES